MCRRILFIGLQIPVFGNLNWYKIIEKWFSPYRKQHGEFSKKKVRIELLFDPDILLHTNI